MTHTDASNYLKKDFIEVLETKIDVPLYIHREVFPQIKDYILNNEFGTRECIKKLENIIGDVLLSYGLSGMTGMVFGKEIQKAYHLLEQDIKIE